MLGILALLVLLAVAAWAVSSATRTTTTEQRTFPAAEVDALQVSGDAGDLSIVVEERDDIAVTTQLTRGLGDEATSQAEVSGASLSVLSQCERAWLFSRCQTDHRIALPLDAISSVQVTAVAGRVEIDGFSGDVQVMTTAGRVSLSRFAGETARLETTAGEVAVQATVAPRTLQVSTRAGEVDIAVPDEVYRVAADTTVGSVDVDVREDAEAERAISVSTTAGAVTIRSE